MIQKKNMYSIGQLAKMCNASVKQLRYLDEKKILVPKMRNLQNNYRYYSPEQLNDLIIIKTLRDLGFSFEEMVGILEKDSIPQQAQSISRQIEAAHEELNEAMYRYQRLVSYYTQFLQSHCESSKFSMGTQGEQGSNFIVVTLPRQRVVFTRRKSSATSGQLFIHRFFELHKKCTDRRITAYANMIAIFHDGYMRQFNDAAEDLETMLPIPDFFALEEDVRDFGGFTGVSAVHKGKYSDMKTLYLQMAQWAKKQGLRLMDASVEIYHLGPDMTSDTQTYITQVFIPLEGSIL